MQAFEEEPAEGLAAALADLHWLPAPAQPSPSPEPGAQDDGAAAAAAAPGVLLTGDAANRRLKLWGLDLARKPVCCHALRLASDAAAADGGSAAPAAAFYHLELQPGCGLALLANEARGRVVALHVAVRALGLIVTND
jgi:hypothetical protein